MKIVVNKVNTHKMTVLAKVNKLVPPSSTVTEFERASIKLQKQQLAHQQEAIQKKTGCHRSYNALEDSSVGKVYTIRG